MAAAEAVTAIAQQPDSTLLPKPDTSGEEPARELDFADLPDDFDQAYEWFAHAYSLDEHAELDPSTTKTGESLEPIKQDTAQAAVESLQAEAQKSDQSQPETLLNESERVSLSQFIENVLQAPVMRNLNSEPEAPQLMPPLAQPTGVWPQNYPFALPSIPGSAPPHGLIQPTNQPGQPLQMQAVPGMMPNAMPIYQQLPGAGFYPYPLPPSVYGYQIPVLQPVLPSAGKQPVLPHDSRQQDHPRELQFGYEQPPSNRNETDQANWIWKRPKRGVLAGDALRKKHCTSEKRRRDTIKQLIIDICALVPSLHNDEEISKSELLRRIYSFLINIAHSNKMLRAELQGMGIDTSQIPANKLSKSLPDLPNGLLEVNPVVHTRARQPSKYDIKDVE